MTAGELIKLLEGVPPETEVMTLLDEYMEYVPAKGIREVPIGYAWCDQAEQSSWIRVNPKLSKLEKQKTIVEIV